MAEARGTLVFDYRPIPVTPMSVALLILFALVTFVLGPLGSPPELWPLGGLCFLPFLLLAGFVVLTHPSPTRIYRGEIEVSLPLWRRLVGGKRYYPWEEGANVYPAPYEVSGAFLSPFASSAGPLGPKGSGLEAGGGGWGVVRFTPGDHPALARGNQGFQWAD